MVHEIDLYYRERPIAAASLALSNGQDVCDIMFIECFGIVFRAIGEGVETFGDDEDIPVGGFVVVDKKRHAKEQEDEQGQGK